MCLFEPWIWADELPFIIELAIRNYANAYGEILDDQTAISLFQELNG